MTTSAPRPIRGLLSGALLAVLLARRLRGRAGAGHRGLARTSPAQLPDGILRHPAARRRRPRDPGHRSLVGAGRCSHPQHGAALAGPAGRGGSGRPGGSRPGPGWTSASLGDLASSPDLQRRHIVRQGKLLDAAHAIAVFQLTFTDLDLGSLAPAPGSIPPLFARLGLADVNLVPTPALAAWEATFARPRR